MGSSQKYKRLDIRNDIQELNRVVPFLDQLQEEWDLPVSVIPAINLALEEALSNIIFYGIDPGIEEEISIEFKAEGNCLNIILSDTGKAFDPTQNMEPDLDLPAEVRPIGGLGIFLIRKMMDEVSYERINGTNRLVMVKHWDNNK